MNIYQHVILVIEALDIGWMYLLDFAKLFLNKKLYTIMLCSNKPVQEAS